MGTRKHHRKNKKWSGGMVGENQQSVVKPAPETLTQPQVEKLVAQFTTKYTTEDVEPGSTIKKISTDTLVSEIIPEDMNAIKEEAQSAVANAEPQPESQAGGRRRRRSRKTRKTRRSRRRN